ncbi:hypothetical protein [Rossellomorea aquimaris]|uniref:hypothetical protein n=1 Tax=Rossellomorea TaxID=2837508 RepID=UPI001653DFEF|nr:hypothetical protein [Rossellomorea aquimaris]
MAGSLAKVVITRQTACNLRKRTITVIVKEKQKEKTGAEKKEVKLSAALQSIPS